MIFDTHAHYDDTAFDNDRKEVIDKLNTTGIKNLLNAASSLKSIENTIKLTREYNFIYGGIGVHPSETAQLNEDNFTWLTKMLQEHKYRGKDEDILNKIVAVGEIGLDYYWNEPDKELQRYWFERQLKLSVDEDMPVIIHSRDAAADTLEMIKEACEYAKSKDRMLSGVIHCFSYGKEIAKEYLKLGFYIGITGVITFKNAKKLVEAVESIPLDKLVIETDAPYLAPEPYRGKRNTSDNLSYVTKRIAEIKGISTEEVEEATYHNALKLYRL